MKIGVNFQRLLLTFFVISFLFKLKLSLFDPALVSESFAYSPIYSGIDISKAFTISTIGNVIFSFIGIGLLTNTFKDEDQAKQEFSRDDVVLFAGVAFVVLLIFMSLLVIEQILL